MRKSRKLAWQQEIARERISILFDLARKEFDLHPERSKRYVELARKIGLRYNIRFPRELKREFCKACNSLLIVGKSSSVRISKKSMVVKCLNCNKVYRYVIKRR